MIKSEIVYTKKVFNDFAVFNIKNNREMKFIYVCSAIIVALSIIMFVTKDYVSGTVFVTLGVLFGCFGFLMKLLINQNNKKNIGSKDYYEFFDDKFVISSHDINGEEIATSSLLYNRLYKVEKYLNYGYIYVNKAVAYIIDKNNFEKEEDFNFVLDKISTEIINQKINFATSDFCEDINGSSINLQTKDVEENASEKVEKNKQVINKIEEDVSKTYKPDKKN